MKVALYHRLIDPSDAIALDQLVTELRQAAIDIFVVRDGDSVDGADYLFSIGGDGTLLSSVQLIRHSDPATFPPILGINFGHLGFLTTVGRENIATLVGDLLAGRFTLEERSLLQMETSLSTPHTSLSTHFALNEVFLHRGDAMTLLRTQVYVDGDYVATYAGDGVIVATPTGSTAYSLSCGGPILTPNSRSFVVTPISAHTLTLRPIIVPDTATLCLKVEGTQFSLGIDSRREAMQGSASFDIRRAPFTIRLIRMNTQNFFSAIRDKLMWGTEVRP